MSKTVLRHINSKSRFSVKFFFANEVSECLTFGEMPTCHLNRPNVPLKAVDR